MKQPPIDNDLFGKPIEPPEFPDWFVAGKNTPRTYIARVAAGKHPIGRELGPETSSCGTCSNLWTKRYGKTYHKCKLVRETNGPGSDVRLKWRGCEFWNQEVTTCRQQ